MLPTRNLPGAPDWQSLFAALCADSDAVLPGDKPVSREDAAA
jgi:hypothetical protein